MRFSLWLLRLVGVYLPLVVKATCHYSYLSISLKPLTYYISRCQKYTSLYRGEAEKARVEYTKALEMVQEQGQTLLLNLANQRLSQAGVRTFALGSRNATVK